MEFSAGEKCYYGVNLVEFGALKECSGALFPLFAVEYGKISHIKLFKTNKIIV